MNMIKGDATRAFRCAKYIHERYESKGYRVQTLVDPNSNEVVVQVCNTGKGIWAGAKKWVGLKTCATLKLTPTEEGLAMDVGSGEWLAKTTDIIIGTFVACGLIAVTGTIGTFKQRALLKNIREDALEYFASDLVKIQPASPEVEAIDVES